MRGTLGRPLTVLAWLLVFAVFALELRFNDGANVSLLYVVVLLLGLWTPSPWDVLHIAGLATGLSAISYANSPAAWDPSVATWNHVLEIIVVWITAFGVNLHRRTLQQRERAERQARDAEAKLREQAALARIGTMATIVAHEVRNPLAGIRGAMQVIARRLEPGGREHAITSEIVARVDALNALLTTLLNFAHSNEPPDAWWDARESAPAATAGPDSPEDQLAAADAAS
jgi:signal transduction histidine kinase